MEQTPLKSCVNHRHRKKNHTMVLRRKSLGRGCSRFMSANLSAALGLAWFLFPWRNIMQTPLQVVQRCCHAKMGQAFCYS